MIGTQLHEKCAYLIHSLENFVVEMGMLQHSQIEQNSHVAL